MLTNVGAKIPEGHLEKLKSLAQGSGRSVSSLVGEAIAVYLGDVSQESITARLVAIERRLDSVEQGQQALRTLIR
jgi:hypothetical protein